MPCYNKLRAGQTAQQREREVQESVDRLKELLATGQAKIIIGPEGGIAFQGWTDRRDISDLCAYHRLLAEGCAELTRSIIMAETQQGRKVSAAAIAGGLHSHDEGQTWSRE